MSSGNAGNQGDLDRKSMFIVQFDQQAHAYKYIQKYIHTYTHTRTRTHTCTRTRTRTHIK